MRIIVTFLVALASSALAWTGNQCTVRDGQIFVGCADNTVLGCLAGRTGTSNDHTISTSGSQGGTITGSTATTAPLNLKATSSTTDNGSVVINPGLTAPTNFRYSLAFPGPSTLTGPFAGSMGLGTDGTGTSTTSNVNSGAGYFGITDNSIFNYPSTVGSTQTFTAVATRPQWLVPTGKTATVKWFGLDDEPGCGSVSAGACEADFQTSHFQVFDVYSKPSFDPNAYVDNWYGLFLADHVSTARVANKYGVYMMSSGSVDSVYGTYLENMSATHNIYGLYYNAQTHSPTLNYPLYILDTASKSIIGGSMRVGDTADPVQTFEVKNYAVLPSASTWLQAAAGGL